MGFRLETVKKSASVTIRDGTTLQGSFFVSASAPGLAGSERVVDLLNSERGCIPFETTSGDIVLLFRDHIASVRLAEAETDPSLSFARHACAKIFLLSGLSLEGSVFIDLPRAHNRLSDFFNLTPGFFPVVAPGGTYLVNMRLILKVSPLPE